MHWLDTEVVHGFIARLVRVATLGANFARLFRLWAQRGHGVLVGGGRYHAPNARGDCAYQQTLASWGGLPQTRASAGVGVGKGSMDQNPSNRSSCFVEGAPEVRVCTGRLPGVVRVLTARVGQLF